VTYYFDYIGFDPIGIEAISFEAINVEAIGVEAISVEADVEADMARWLRITRILLGVGIFWIVSLG
jgi:hypothetical protein